MSTLDDVRWLALPSVPDHRGVLTAIESGVDVPFEIRRVFWVHDVAAERGGHAHRDTDQVAVAAAGSLRVEILDGGGGSATYELDRPARGLFVPRMLFTRLYDFSPGAVCLVLASTHYDRARSIRTWEDFLRERRRGAAEG
jgi:hypothetical protein